MTNYTILCLCNDTVCAGGWVMLPGKCFWFKNCLQALSPQSWRVSLCGVLSTEVPAVPLPCGNGAVLGALTWPFVIHGASFALRMFSNRKYYNKRSRICQERQKAASTNETWWSYLWELLIFFFPAVHPSCCSCTELDGNKGPGCGVAHEVLKIVTIPFQ